MTGWRQGRIAVLIAALGASGCGRGVKSFNAPAPTPISATATAAEIQTLWAKASREYARGKWNKAATLFERVTLEVPAGDTLATAAHFRLAECYFGQKQQLQAAREFRKVSDDAPTSHLAPEALLRAGDAYADLWRRPELDPTYGQTSLATYQELLNRYPDAPAASRARMRIADLEEMFARKDFKTATYYYRLKAYDSAILYLKDIAASYPRASITPDVLLTLVHAYQKVNYAEDVTETCSYIRRYHPNTPGVDAACPVARDTTPPAPAAPTGTH
jgi:outer membrane protein assembly factor BamD